jgi:hypothetical protein
MEKELYFWGVMGTLVLVFLVIILTLAGFGGK